MSGFQQFPKQCVSALVCVGACVQELFTNWMYPSCISPVKCRRYLCAHFQLRLTLKSYNYINTIIEELRLPRFGTLRQQKMDSEWQTSTLPVISEPLLSRFVGQLLVQMNTNKLIGKWKAANDTQTDDSINTELCAHNIKQPQLVSTYNVPAGNISECVMIFFFFSHTATTIMHLSGLQAGEVDLEWKFTEATEHLRNADAGRKKYLLWFSHHHRDSTCVQWGRGCASAQMENCCNGSDGSQFLSFLTARICWGRVGDIFAVIDFTWADKSVNPSLHFAQWKMRPASPQGEKKTSFINVTGSCQAHFLAPQSFSLLQPKLERRFKC